MCSIIHKEHCTVGKDGRTFAERKWLSYGASTPSLQSHNNHSNGKMVGFNWEKVMDDLVLTVWGSARLPSLLALIASGYTVSLPHHVWS